MQTDNLVTFEQALLDPSRYFNSPRDVAEAEGLSAAQKLSLLKRWEVDEMLLQVAANEGMTGGEQPQFALVRDQIKALSEHDG